MCEVYSNAEDCNKIAKLLYGKLRNKIEFYGTTYQEVVSGKYHCLPYSAYESYNDYLKDELSFSYKFCENGFLRISIGDLIYKNSVGHKLAALSDFYETLSEIYGMPTLFYTIRDDDENTLNMQWSFSRVEEYIQEFRNGTAFDDAEIDELIVFGETKVQNNSHRLNDTTRMLISRQIGLPFEMIYLIDEHIEDFIKYKHGKAMWVPKDKKVNGYPVTTLEDANSKISQLQEPTGPVLGKKKKIDKHKQ